MPLSFEPLFVSELESLGATLKDDSHASILVDPDRNLVCSVITYTELDRGYDLEHVKNNDHLHDHFKIIYWLQLHDANRPGGYSYIEGSDQYIYWPGAITRMIEGFKNWKDDPFLSIVLGDTVKKYFRMLDFARHHKYPELQQELICMSLIQKKHFVYWCLEEQSNDPFGHIHRTAIKKCVELM